MLTQRISVPETGKHILPIEAGHIIEFAFDTGTVTFDRSGHDLEIFFESGSSVSLEGFFAPEEGYGLPVLLLEDGTEVRAADFLHTANPVMDISTAAGPEQPVGSHGFVQYSDYSSTILNGVDRLGSLGTDGWSRSTNAPLGMEEAASPSFSPSGAAPEPMPEPVPEPGDPLSYHTRTPKRSIFCHIIFHVSASHEVPHLVLP